MIQEYIKRRTKEIVIIFVSCFISVNVFAQTSEVDIKTSIDKNNAEIKRLETEIANYTKQVTTSQKEANTLKEAIKVLESRKNNLENEISLANQKITITRSNISSVTDKITDTDSKIRTVVYGISDSLRQKEKLITQDNILLRYASADSFSSLYDKFYLNQTFQNELHKAETLLKELNSNLTNNKLAYQTEYKNLNELQTSLKDKKLSVTINQKEKDVLLKTTKENEENYKKILADRKIKKASLEKEVLDFESKLKAIVDINKLPKSGSGVLQYPVKNVKITQYFGTTPFSTQNPQVYNGAGHNGIDFGVPIGTALYSAADGTVTGTGDSDIACSGVSYGKWVLIKHNNGLSTLYAHLSVIQTSAGQAVSSGDKIGLSGSTGYSTGPHLHFTVYASDAVRISGNGEYKSKVCGTELRIPVAPRNGYLNPLTFL